MNGVIVVTGGAGFIGSNFVREWFAHVPDARVVVLDALTYAGHLESLEAVKNEPGFAFVQGDIADSACVNALIAQYQPVAIVNFAAESHVDRSIHGPEDFIQTNIVGTFRLLEAVRSFWNDQDE